MHNSGSFAILYDENGNGWASWNGGRVVRVHYVAMQSQ